MVEFESRLGEIVASHQTVAAIDDRQLGMGGPLRGVEKNGDPAFFEAWAVSWFA